MGLLKIVTEIPKRPPSPSKVSSCRRILLEWETIGEPNVVVVSQDSLEKLKLSAHGCVTGLGRLLKVDGHYNTSAYVTVDGDVAIVRTSKEF